MVEDIDKGTYNNEDSNYTSKLKKLKGKRASKSDPKKYIYLLLVAVIVLGLSYVGFNIYNNMMEEAHQKTITLEKAREGAINTINQMFSKYPGDPQHTLYINKIKNCKSVDEVNNVLDEVNNYIKFIKYRDNVINDIKNNYKPYYENNLRVRTLVNKIKSAKSKDEVDKIANELHNYITLEIHKNDKINYIKNTYGPCYNDSIYAKTIVDRIKSAKSIDEVNNILKNANIEENAKKYYINEIENSVAFYNYYRVLVDGQKILMSGEELLNRVNKLSLTDIKNLSANITPVPFNKVAIVVSGTQCGKIPYEGSKIEIYNKNNASMEPILGIINSSYVIIKDMEYSESKGISNNLNEDGYTTSVSSTSSTSYSLKNIPGILYATAADRLDYNKIKNKFGRYGEKLNKIQEDTQIFDEDAKYLLILSVPSDSVSDIISMKDEDIYIVNVE